MKHYFLGAICISSSMLVLDSANFLQKVGDLWGENLSFWVPFSSRCWDSGARLMNGSSS